MNDDSEYAVTTRTYISGGRVTGLNSADSDPSTAGSKLPSVSFSGTA